MTLTSVSADDAELLLQDLSQLSKFVKFVRKV